MLRRWSKELLASELGDTLDPSPESDDWLGYEGATEAEIGQLASRIGVRLPPSYETFLRTTNGWRSTSPSIQRIRPTTEVDWFRVENEQWVATYNDTSSGELPDLPDGEYFRYGEGAPDVFRARHLLSMLQISDVGDGVYLLNPGGGHSRRRMGSLVLRQLDPRGQALRFLRSHAAGGIPVLSGTGEATPSCPRSSQGLDPVAPDPAPSREAASIPDVDRGAARATDQWDPVGGRGRPEQVLAHAVRQAPGPPPGSATTRSRATAERPFLRKP
jgi:SMI1/KNR4 family protein SUKH-1